MLQSSIGSNVRLEPRHFDRRVFAFEWRSDNDTYVTIEQQPSMLFYVRRDQVLKSTMLFTCVTMLLYVIARLQGRIKTTVHHGLHQFWACMVVGELITCLICLIAATYTFFIDNGQPDMLICAQLAPMTSHIAKCWLILWVVFVVAVLRGTVAISWLHRIRDVDRLTDMVRGIGILCASLIYLFPLALLSRFVTYDDAVDDDAFTVCVPEFLHGVDVVMLQIYMFAAWSVGIVCTRLPSGKSSCATDVYYILVCMPKPK